MKFLFLNLILNSIFDIAHFDPSISILCFNLNNNFVFNLHLCSCVFDLGGLALVCN